MKTALVYTTAPSSEEARSLATALINRRLIACANIVDGGLSIVANEDGSQDEVAEHYMLCKTTMGRADEVIGAIEELHSYDTPCVLVWPAVDGSEPFTNWVERATSTV